MKADALRRCSHCHRELPATADYFPLNKGRLGSWCKSCHSDYYYAVRRKPHLSERDALEPAGQRRCTTCLVIKPLDAMHFQPAANRRGGYVTECRVCYNVR